MRENGPQLAAMLVLIAIAFLLSVPQGESNAGWFFNRRVAEDDGAQLVSDRLIPTTKRTVANVEDITEGVKAALVAAGQTIDSRNKVRMSGAEPTDTQVITVQATAEVAPAKSLPPLPEDSTETLSQPTHIDSSTLTRHGDCVGGVCLVEVGGESACKNGSCSYKPSRRVLWRRR